MDFCSNKNGNIIKANKISLYTVTVTKFLLISKQHCGEIASMMTSQLSKRIQCFPHQRELNKSCKKELQGSGFFQAVVYSRSLQEHNFKLLSP